MKKRFTLVMPTMAQLIARRRAGVKPGQVFRDKRRTARVNSKAALRRQSREEA